MAVITLTTEWRPDDFYQGIIKGKLCSLSPGVTIIDNATGIRPFNIARAAFIIRNTYQNYPAGTVHVICVHSEAMKEKGYLVVNARGHFFIGADNGIFNLILNSDPEEVARINHDDGSDELDIFSRAASDLLKGKKLSDIGVLVRSISERLPLRATIEKDVITGSIIFIDSYGNAISNITREVFSRALEGKDYRILIQSNKNCTNRIMKRYSDVAVGELLARFNSLDLLEIAINGANVSELLSIEAGSVVRVDTVTSQPSSDKLF
jgi:hypothetical protein